MVTSVKGIFVHLFRALICLGQNILAGTRCALFLSFRPWHFTTTFTQIVLLLGVSFGLSFIYEYFETSPDNVFNIYGLNYQATLYLLFFFSLALVMRIQNAMSQLMQAIVMFLSIVPVIWLVYVLLLQVAEMQTIFDYIQASWAVFILYLVWYMIITFRIFKKLFHDVVLKNIVYVILYAAINISPLFLIPQQPLWIVNFMEEETGQRHSKIDVEQIYYLQRELLANATNKLYQQRNNFIDMYFIGFAGDADEDVFKNESEQAQQLFDQRFDTFGRSLSLINNSATIYKTPLANLHNLNDAIRNVGELMDLEEDVLILFMTSHGSEDHMLSANFASFNLNDISPVMIRRALDRADIKWRIIIISACYSGGFIKELQNDHSMIITAASENRNSFGCGHDGTFTYFGEAFIDKHLREDFSFANAFEKAAKDIERREREEGYQPSLPQISIGKEIQPHLQKLIEQLQVKNMNNWAMSTKGK